MQAGVGAVIFAVVWDMAKGYVKKRDLTAVLVMAGALVAAVCLRINVIYVVLACIGVGLVHAMRLMRSRKQ